VILQAVPDVGLTFIELSQKAGHDTNSLLTLHGSLFDVHCSRDGCTFTQRNTSKDPTVPGLIVPLRDSSDSKTSIPYPTRDDIPRCPSCNTGLLRPGVVWFGEKLPETAFNRIESWLDACPAIDLVLVIGTERTPFVYDAITHGALVAYFNIFQDKIDPEHMGDADWIVNGDVSQTLPSLVEAAFKTSG
jgi:NAD+-dependent protein deacetylase sirtuin 5